MKMTTQKKNIKYEIFIVEDNTLYAQLLKKHLVSNNYQVRVFYNARDCLNALDEQQPDVLTLDYTLPDMGGHEAMKEIQKRSPQTNIIIISAQESINTAIELMKNGAYDYIRKASDTREKLTNIIKNLYASDLLKNGKSAFKRGHIRPVQFQKADKRQQQRDRTGLFFNGKSNSNQYFCIYQR